MTPLIVAMDNFAFDTARLLFERGANPHVWDWWGRTPLHTAIDMNTYSLDAYAERTGPPIVTEETTALELARLFLDAGVNPNPQLNMHRPGRGGNAARFADEIITTGATPLLRAAAGQDDEAVRLLLDYGGRVDVPNVMGVTPLVGAAGLGMEPEGTDPGPRFNPSADDVEDRAIATLDMLLAAGADVNARITDVKGRTARIGRSTTLPERGGQSALFGAVQWAWPAWSVSDRSRRGSGHRGRPRRVAARRGFGARRQCRQSALRRGRRDTPDGNRQVGCWIGGESCAC